MPRDAVSRTANVERTGWHKWVKVNEADIAALRERFMPEMIGVTEMKK